jgi:hypothetical protein
VVGFRRILSNSEVGGINDDSLQERAKRVNDNNNILANTLADGEIAIGVINFGGAATIGVDFGAISNALGRNSGARVRSVWEQTGRPRELRERDRCGASGTAASCCSSARLFDQERRLFPKRSNRNK